MLTTEQVKELQGILKKQGADPGPIDGDFGPQTEAAVYQVLVGKPAPTIILANEGFDVGARARLSKAHVKLQMLMNEARKHATFTILDSQRGRAAQEKAFKEGKSKAHFGQSAHNWDPAIALDIAPLPINWDDRKAFIALSKIVLPLAKTMGIPIRWGGDWNMNGVLTDESFSDLPHYELHPWRAFAKQSKLYGG